MSERIAGVMSYREGFSKIVAANKIHHLLCVFGQLLSWAIPFDSLVKKKIQNQQLTLTIKQPR